MWEEYYFFFTKTCVPKDLLSLHINVNIKENKNGGGKNFLKKNNGKRA